MFELFVNNYKKVKKRTCLLVTVNHVSKNPLGIFFFGSFSHKNLINNEIKLDVYKTNLTLSPFIFRPSFHRPLDQKNSMNFWREVLKQADKTAREEGQV